MDYKIHYSGSTGNCATLKTNDGVKFMIDAGMPYSRIKNHLKDVEVLLYTHKHGDHLKKSTYNQIRLNHPSIMIIGNHDVNTQVMAWGLPALNYVINSDTPHFWLNETKVTPIENEHDVECYGFIFEEPNNEVTLFATDLSTTLWYREYLNDNNLKIDNLLLESNYNPSVVGFMESLKLHTGFNVFNNGSERHLPTSEWLGMKKHFCKPDARCEELHISQTYHSFDGLSQKFDFSEEDVKEWIANYRQQA